MAVLRIGKDSWNGVSKAEKANSLPQHGLIGRTGADSNRSKVDKGEMNDSLTSFFATLKEEACPRATLIVREAVGGASVVMMIWRNLNCRRVTQSGVYTNDGATNVDGWSRQMQKECISRDRHAPMMMRLMTLSGQVGRSQRNCAAGHSSTSSGERSIQS